MKFIHNKDEKHGDGTFSATDKLAQSCNKQYTYLNIKWRHEHFTG